MSGRELSEWAGYERVAGPLGAERLDALAALQSFYALRAAGAKRVKLADLMPQWDRPEPMDWRHMKMIATGIAKAGGGTVSSRARSSDQ